MGIGTSKGAYYEDEYHYHAAQWDDKYDDNVVKPADTGDDNTVFVGNGLPDPHSKLEYRVSDTQNAESLGADASKLAQAALDKAKAEPQKSYFQKSMDLLHGTNSFPGDIDTSSGLNISSADMDTATKIALGFSGGGLTTAPEKIKSAALMHGDELFEGLNHGFALDQILAKYPQAGMKDIKDGFTTTHGRFVSREEAYKIANQADQLGGDMPAVPEESQMLLAEDLKHVQDKILGKSEPMTPPKQLAQIRAAQEREKQANAAIRAKRDEPVPDFPENVTARIDDLVRQYQDGSISNVDKVELKRLLKSRYK